MTAASSKALVAAVVVLVLAGGASAGPEGRGGKRDTVPPTAPANLRVVSSTRTSVSVRWDASTDNVGVSGYYVHVDGNRTTVSNRSYTARGLACGRTVSIAVVAFDRARNISARREVVTSTAACPDVLPPTPPTGLRQAATAQDAAVLAWDPSTDNLGVVAYGVYRGGLPLTTTVEPTVTLSGLQCSSTYAYEVDAVDAAGNRSARTPVWVVTAECADREPPSTPTDLTVVARTTSSLTLEWSPSTDNVEVAGYRLRLGGAAVGTVLADSVFPVAVRVGGDDLSDASQLGAALRDLACGTNYVVGVEAYDAAGNDSAAATVDAATESCTDPPAPPPADTQRPSVPQRQTIAGATATSFVMSWSPATDNVAVTGYNVFLNGAKVATVTTTSYTYADLTCGTTYTVALEARDAAGNVSNRAEATGPATTLACGSPAPPPPGPADATPPSQPSGLAVASATAGSVSVTWSSSNDNVGVVGYGVYRDGTAISNVAQPGATVTDLSCGTAYTFEVDAYDAAGNRSTRAAVIASTSACPDTQSPTAPANVSATLRTATSIALSWSASSDSVGVTGYSLYQGGVLAGTTTGTTGIFSGLTCNVSYTLAVEAYDAAGNRSPKTTVIVSTAACPADTAPPSVPQGQTVSAATQTGFVMSWSAATDNVGVTGYNVYLNGTRVATVTTTSHTYAGLTCGTTYTVALEARDAAGNVSNRTQATGSASTLACASSPPPPPPPPPPPTSSANLYVSTSGSDANPCTQLLPCSTFQRAYALAAPGAVVEVAGGTYPSQRLTAVPGKAAPNVDFREAPGQSVVLGGLSIGSGEANEGPDYITVRGMETTYKGTAPGAANQQGIWVGPGSSYIELVNMDAGSVDSWKADHLTVRGGDYGPCRPLASGNICGNNKQDLGTNVLIEGAYIHDFDYDPSNLGAHWECMYINAGRNVTIRGNRFERCAIFDVFVTLSGSEAGQMGHDNLTIENNFFAPALDGNGNPSRGWSSVSVAWCQNGPQPSYRNVKIRNNSFAPGAGIERDLNADGAGCQWQNVSVVGNVMAYQEGCQRGWTYAYNAMGASGRGVTGTCSSTDRVVASLPYVNSSIDFHLAASSIIDNLVPPAECAATDIDGESRPMGPSCDAGADER